MLQAELSEDSEPDWERSLSARRLVSSPHLNMSVFSCDTLKLHKTSRYLTAPTAAASKYYSWKYRMKKKSLFCSELLLLETESTQLNPQFEPHEPKQKTLHTPQHHRLTQCVSERPSSSPSTPPPHLLTILLLVSPYGGFCHFNRVSYKALQHQRPCTQLWKHKDLHVNFTNSKS